MSIPKVIHYCWFGNSEKSRLAKDCILSWKKILPEYKIIEWNEKNTDLKHPFLKNTYSQKKWAFVADFVRLKVLYDYGGIYLDTDMMILKPLDNFLKDNCFFGAENETYINAALIGARKNHPFIKECLSYYEDLKLNNETNWEEICIPRIITKIFQIKYGSNLFLNTKTETKEMKVYPPAYFYPLSYKSRGDIKNYQKYLKLESHSVHLWNGSWIEPNEFHYLRKGQYSEGLKIVMNNIVANRKISFFYLRKILSSIKESF